MARAWERGVPLTVHAAIGAEITHQHQEVRRGGDGRDQPSRLPHPRGIAPRAARRRPGREQGSAVVLPEVFVKALNVARHLWPPLVNFTAVDLDMSRHYRPEMNVIGTRPRGRARISPDRPSRAHDPPLLRAAGAPRSMTGRAILAALAVALGACASAGGGESPPPHTGTAPAPRSEPPATASVPSPADESLPPWLAAIAGARSLRAHWGIAVWDLDEGRWVLRHEADRYFVPAPNLKLVVSATGLERLGPDYTWRTSVYGTAPVGRGGVLDGDLVLYGRGDPTCRDASRRR